MIYHYSLRHIKALRKVVLLRKMWIPDYFKQMSSRRMQKYYNGIGPESWSTHFRGIVTRILNRLEASALIHDVEWSRRKKSFRHFVLTNLRLAWNATLETSIRTGITIGLLCMIFGYRGYKGTKKEGRK